MSFKKTLTGLAFLVSSACAHVNSDSDIKAKAPIKLETSMRLSRVIDHTYELSNGTLKYHKSCITEDSVPYPYVYEHITFIMPNLVRREAIIINHAYGGFCKEGDCNNIYNLLPTEAKEDQQRYFKKCVKI